MITMKANDIRSLLKSALPSRKRVAQEANTLSKLVKQADGDKSMAQLLVIRQYGPTALTMVNTLSGYLEMASGLLPTLIRQAEEALPAIERGWQFMADNEGYSQSLRTYLESNGAPEKAYLQTVGKIGAALLEDAESEAEIHNELTQIVAKYGPEKEPEVPEETLTVNDLFMAMFN